MRLLYLKANFDKERFIRNMEALKRENQAYKDVLCSKQYKIGKYFSEFSDAFHSLTQFRKYLRILNGKFRWKKLCKLYPINQNSVSRVNKANYFFNEEIIIYTSIFGNYDLPQEPVFKPDNCKFLIFTDQEISADSVWEKQELPLELLNGNYTNAEKNRFCKMLPHHLFPNAHYSIYIDGNIKSITDLTEFVNCCSEIGMALHMHKARRCVYEELEACRLLKKAPISAIDAYKRFLERQHFPRNYGMNECNVIVRDHANPVVCQIMEEWWDTFKKGDVKRDQLSFPFLLYKHGIKPSEIATLGMNVQENPAIRVVEHI